MGELRAVKVVSGRMVRDLVGAAVEAAQQQDMAMSVAVCDPSGELLGFHRMDGAVAGTVEVAQLKARTAARFGRSTRWWGNVLEQDAALSRGLKGVTGFVPVGGGVPVYVDGVLVGAVGISGGHHAEDDGVGRSAIEAVLGDDDEATPTG